MAILIIEVILVYKKMKNELKVFKIDNEGGFSYKPDSDYYQTSKDIEDAIKNNLLTEEIIEMPWLQQEKKEMLIKITELDLSDSSVIATIVENIVEDSCKDQERWVTKKLLQPETRAKVLSEIAATDPKKAEEYSQVFSKNDLENELAEINENDTHQCGAEMIMKELRLRQKQVRDQLDHS